MSHCKPVDHLINPTSSSEWSKCHLCPWSSSFIRCLPALNPNESLSFPVAWIDLRQDRRSRRHLPPQSPTLFGFKSTSLQLHASDPLVYCWYCCFDSHFQLPSAANHQELLSSTNDTEGIWVHFRNLCVTITGPKFNLNSFQVGSRTELESDPLRTNIPVKRLIDSLKSVSTLIRIQFEPDRAISIFSIF